MNLLLDTNVVSEFGKRYPNAKITAFVQAQPATTLWLSVLTLGELRRGIVAEARRQMAIASIQQWAEQTERDFAGRILPVTVEIAQAWGVMSAGRTRPVVDTLLAATAQVHGLTVVTRNTRDFANLGVPVLNPWE